MSQRHAEKTFCIAFTPTQERVCKLRRRLSAELVDMQRAAPQLVEILYDSDYTASIVAARTMGTRALWRGSPASSSAVVALVETVLRADPDQRYFAQQLRTVAIDGLSQLNIPAELESMTIGALLAATRDSDSTVICAALDALGRIGPQPMGSAIASCLDHHDAGVRQRARATLAALANPATAQNAA